MTTMLYLLLTLNTHLRRNYNNFIEKKDKRYVFIVVSPLLTNNLCI